LPFPAIYTHTDEYTKKVCYQNSQLSCEDAVTLEMNMDEGDRDSEERETKCEELGIEELSHQ
jgi:hypothetical protein